MSDKYTKFLMRLVLIVFIIVVFFNWTDGRKNVIFLSMTSISILYGINIRRNLDKYIMVFNEITKMLMNKLMESNPLLIQVTNDKINRDSKDDEEISVKSIEIDTEGKRLEVIPTKYFILTILPDILQIAYLIFSALFISTYTIQVPVYIIYTLLIIFI